MLTGYMFEKIRQKKRDGKSNNQIAKELGIDRRTVKKYSTSNAPPKYSQRSAPTREDPAVGFDTQIRDMLEKCPTIHGYDIFVRLRQVGYVGSLRTIQRRLGELRRDQPKERFFEQRYRPGEQSQVDFKECLQLPFRDGMRLVHLLIGTLPYSGVHSAKAFPMRNFESFMEGVHSFFETIGGMTRELRLDNLSPCVRRVCSGMRRDYTAAFQRAIDYYGFVPSPCSPGKGNEKGDVERQIQTLVHRLGVEVKLTGRVFSDFDDLNLWLSELCHRERGPVVTTRFDEESKALSPLPERRPEILCRIATVVPTTFGLVTVGEALYSVPDELISCPCRATVSPYRVTIEEIGGRHRRVEHPRVADKEKSILLEHVLRSLVRKPRAMVRWAHQEVLFPSATFRSFYQRLKALDPESAERQYLRSINLIQLVPLTEIEAGIEVILGSDYRDPYLELRTLLLSSGHSPAREVVDQQPLSPQLGDYDFLIPSFQEVSSL